MKKPFLIIALLGLFLAANAQAFKVTSAQTLIDEYFSSNETYKLEEAKTLIDEAVAFEKTINSGRAWFVRGKVYQLFHQDTVLRKKYPTVNYTDEAFTSYKKAIQVNDVKFSNDEKTDLFKFMSGLLSSFFNKGADLYSAKEYAKAYQEFMKVEEGYAFFTANSKTFPKEIPMSAVRQNAGLCAQKAGLVSEATKMYEELVAKDNPDAGTYGALADLYAASGKTQEAMNLITKGIEKYPSNIDLRIVELNFYLSQGKPELAIDKINKTIELDPKNKTLLFVLGQALGKAKQYDEAAKAYDRAIALDDKYLDAYINCGALYVDQANDCIKQQSALSNSAEDNKKNDELNAKKKAFFLKAKPYVDKALVIDPSNEQLKRVQKKIDVMINY